MNKLITLPGLDNAQNTDDHIEYIASSLATQLSPTNQHILEHGALRTGARAIVCQELASAVWHSSEDGEEEEDCCPAVYGGHFSYTSGPYATKITLVNFRCGLLRFYRLFHFLFL